MIEVENKVMVYEIEGQEMITKPILTVYSHWNRDEFVVLQFEDEKKYTVLAKDLEAAIRNAKNTSRY